jgi:pyruvate,water dikinase
VAPIATDHLLLNLAQADDIAAVGSKAFNLGRLERLQVPTPGGMVIPDTAFQAHLARAGVVDRIAHFLDRLPGLSLSDLEAEAGAIRGCISATCLDSALSEALAGVWRTSWRNQLLAVRSSAVGEDSILHSFAGQLDSHLHVDSTSALEAAIKATWSSLFAQRVLLYARHHGVRSSRMGVIVQAQVDARASGVLFTRDPMGHDSDNMLAEYSHGLGDEVVSGKITPGRIRIRRSDLALNYEHTDTDVAPLGEPHKCALMDIARIGQRLEAEAGLPQDLEWCIDADARPVIVQARPVTRAASPANKVHWSNANIAENFPDPVSPFLYSIVRPGYSAYFRNLGYAFGISNARIAAVSEQLTGIVGLQGGRLYYNLTNINELLRMMPGGDQLVGFFNLFVGTDPIPQPPTDRLGAVARTAEFIRIAASIVWQYLFIHRRVHRFESRVNDFARNTQPGTLAGKSAAELAADLRGFLHIRMNQWTDAALADTAAMVCYGLLKVELTSSLGPGNYGSLHNDLLKGLPGLASAQPVSCLWNLSRTIAADPVLRAAFLQATAEGLPGLLEQERFAMVRREFADYLETWGFRSSGELMLTTPTPLEDPRPLLRLLQAYVRADVRSPDEVARTQQQEREATTVRVAGQLAPAGLWRHLPFGRPRRFLWLLAATQGAIQLRERARMKQALLYTRLRHIALHLGDRLVEQGVFDRREDVFFLTTDEVLEQAVTDPVVTAAPRLDFAELIEARRRAFDAAAGNAAPDVLVLPQGAQWTPTTTVRAAGHATASARQLSGTGACGGSAIGVAAIVLDVAEADRIQAGQILVTRHTDPGWATVFFLVQGLVIERGGMLSHGAIIAREYGIPAVVGVPDATRLIADGDRIRVEGDQGIVELGVV